ncbi:MAG: ATP-binding protein [Bacteroidia bacterium]|nr:ATP-binding protein [Bacteroidia bacterium]
MQEIKKISYSILTSKINQYLIVIFIIALTALLCRPLSNQQGYYIVSFILLFVVSIMAAFLSIGPILLASTISSLVWNYFFIPPHFAFHIEKTEDKLMFGSFFFIALINGILTYRIRRQEKLALEREERTNAIFKLTRELSNTSGVNEILDVAFLDVKKYFNASAIFFLQEKKSKIEILVKRGNEKDHFRVDYKIAEWVFKNSMKAGRFTDFYNETSLTYYPLTGKQLSPGVIAIGFEKSLSSEKEIFWIGYFTQISNALERELLSELALKARVLDESDKLYKTLFTLISHEFRIPIATIMGASDTLLMPQTTDKDRTQLFEEIFKASARLNHLVENLLNMSRLESGKISARLDWCDINDLLNNVTKILKQELEQFHLLSSIPTDMPLVRLDFGLMEQVIYNLVLNSCQYTPAGSIIRFNANYRGSNLIILVEDNGPGFPQESLDKIFNKFFRVDSLKAGGLGLGLSIVKGLVEAHKGTVKVENLETKGAKFTITIPTEIPDIKNLELEE